MMDSVIHNPAGDASGTQLFLGDPSGDAQQPGVKRLRLPQLLQGQESPDKRLLRRFFHLPTVSKPSRQVGEQRF